MPALRELDRSELESMVAEMQHDIKYYRTKIKKMRKRIAKRDDYLMRNFGIKWGEH